MAKIATTPEAQAALLLAMAAKAKDEAKIFSEIAQSYKPGRANHRSCRAASSRKYAQAEALAAGAKALRDVARMREALESARDQFRFYQSEHEKAGKTEKAATNQRFADLMRDALNRDVA